jgi:hypothetical protein
MSQRSSHYGGMRNHSGAGKLNQQLLTEFENELERLREENNQIRFARDLRDRDFENVIFENA